MKLKVVGFLLLILAAAALFSLHRVESYHRREERPDIIQVAQSDAEMNLAMARARSTLPDFWDARAKQGQAFAGVLKVYFADPGRETEGEHMWVEVRDHADDRITGTLLSRPVSLHSVHEGQTVEFPAERVSDWIYVENGRAMGGYTVRLLRSRLRADQLQAYDAQSPFRFD